MKLKFDVTVQEFKIIKNILKSALPANCTVWVFGSRAKNQAKFNSDLDLALDYKNKVALKTLLLLEEAFEESPLPYTVDVLDIKGVSEKFQAIIRQQAIAFPLAKSNKVSKLRFKDVQGNAFPDWVEKRLGEVAPNPSYGMNAPAVPFDGTHKYIRITDIDADTRVFVPDPLTSPQKPIAKKYKLRNGDIVFARTGASTGKTYLFDPKDGDLYFAGFLIRFRIKSDNPAFIYSQTLRQEYKKWVTVMSMRSGQPGVNANEYSQLKIPIPTLAEQQKIASFLSSVDRKIAQIAKKKALLEQYKKGCMQKLFSQELRFKDAQGNAFPDWGKMVLADILDYQQPTPYLVESAEYDDSYTTPVLTAGKTFLLGYTNETTGIFEKNLPTIIFDDFTTAFKYVVFPFKAKSSAMKMLIPKNSGVNLQFVHVAMSLIRFPLGEHKRYWISEYQWEKIGYPSLPEQQKIAAFLSAIDWKTDLITTELEHIKTFKKGLLQQMFV